MPPPEDAAKTTILHASCVALDNRALLITGATGSGKSALALEMMAFGAILVADDRVVLTRKGIDITASAVPTIAGLIEARGFGVLNAVAAGPTPVCAVIDLDQTETDRIPTPRYITLIGTDLPLFYIPQVPHSGAALMQYLRAGRSDR